MKEEPPVIYAGECQNTWPSAFSREVIRDVVYSTT
jgi:hypothetical protein